jgi:hypothetical protein
MNIAEAVNFAPLDWTPYGLKCMLRYQEHGRAPVFSHEELICTVLKQESSVKTAIWYALKFISLCAIRRLFERLLTNGFLAFCAQQAQVAA